METQVSKTSLKKCLLVRTVFPKLFVEAKYAYFVSDKRLLETVRKAVDSNSKEKEAVTLLMHCPYLVSHQATFLYCFVSFWILLHSGSWGMVYPSPLNTPVQGGCEYRSHWWQTAESSERILEYVQASECQKWKTTGHNVQKSCIPWTLILSGLVKATVTKGWNLILLIILVTH